MRENRLSQGETARKYGIVRSMVQRWERIYLESGLEGLKEERRGQASGERKGGRSPKMAKKVEEDLIAENQRLRMENAYLKKLNALVQVRELREKKRR